MKIKLAVVFAATMAASTTVLAQSSVTLYGLMALGVAYSSNEGGHSSAKLLSGTMQNSRWGMRGVEDLGSGNQALFVLEGGFGADDGRAQQGGRLFGRQAYIGLANDTVGQVTLGRQYDAMYDTLTGMSASIAGLAVHVGDNDAVFGSFRHNNSIKYVTPTWGGFRAEVQYGLSDVAGSKDNRSISLGGIYESGPLRLAGAMMRLDSPGMSNPNGAVTDDYASAPFVLFHTSPLDNKVGVSSQRVAGLAGGYTIGAVKINAMVTAVRYEYKDGTALRLNNYDLNVGYQLTPALLASAAYVFTNGRYDGINSKPNWHMGQLSLDYFLSKRTDVYVYGIYQRAHSATADIYNFSPSSGASQTVVVTGIRHKF